MPGRTGWLVALGAAVMAGAAPASALDRAGTTAPDGAPWASGWRSRAAVEWEAHRGHPVDPYLPVAFVASPAYASSKPSEILGFLPHWNIGQAVVRVDRLTTLAYFGVDVRGDGSLGDARHWGTPALAPLMDAARAAGVRVVLTAVCMDETTLGTLLASPAARAKAVAALVELVRDAGGDGVNVDFEGVPVARKSGLTAFVGELKAALDKALGTSHVTVDTPAIDWNGSYDYDALALACDGLVIMGYDYHWRGGDPGPVAPLATRDTASRLSLTWTLDDYDQWGGMENRRRFVLALPLYGYDWPVAADVTPGDATGEASSRFYADCGRRATEAGGWRWDEVSATPWIGYKDGARWRQMWCENLASLEAKAALAADRDLGGVAYWALGYEEESDDPWTAVDRAYGLPVAEPVPEPLPDHPADVTEPADAFEDGPVETVSDAGGPEAAVDTGGPEAVGGDGMGPPDEGAPADDLPGLDAADDGSAAADVAGAAEEGAVAADEGALAGDEDADLSADPGARTDAVVELSSDPQGAGNQGSDDAGRAGSGCSAAPGLGGRGVSWILLSAIALWLARRRLRTG